jgi:hypothetical protein
MKTVDPEALRLVFRCTDLLRRFLSLATKVAGGSSTRLLNHPIRLDQDVLWYYKPKLLSRLKVDEYLEF